MMLFHILMSVPDHEFMLDNFLLTCSVFNQSWNFVIIITLLSPLYLNSFHYFLKASEDKKTGPRIIKPFIDIG